MSTYRQRIGRLGRCHLAFAVAHCALNPRFAAVTVGSCGDSWKLRRVAGEASNMMENALSILIVIFSAQLQQTEISERKLFIFHLWAQRYWHAQTLIRTHGFLGQRVIDMHRHSHAHVAFVGTVFLTCTGIDPHTSLLWAQSYWHAQALTHIRGFCGQKVIDMHRYCPAHVACVGTELLTCAGFVPHTWLVWALSYWHAQALPSTRGSCGHWVIDMHRHWPVYMVFVNVVNFSWLKILIYKGDNDSVFVAIGQGLDS